MKKTARILIIFVILCFVFAFVGCSQVKTTLAVPENVQVIDNVVHWNMVDGAVGYYLTINTVGHEVAKEKGTHFDLKNANIPSGTQCEISVRAVGDGYVNLSSGYSEPIFHLYIANETNDNNNSGNNNTGNNDNTNTGNNNNNNGGSNTGNNNTGNNTPDSGTNDDNNTDNNDNNQTVQPKPVTFKSAYYDLGIGRTVNAITDEYLEVDNYHTNLFTEEVLSTLTWAETKKGKMESKSSSASTMEELYSGKKEEYGGGFEISGGWGVFTAGVELKFDNATNEKWSKVTNEFYYDFSQYYTAYYVSIAERNNIDKLRALMQQSVLNDVTNLSAEDFFDKYGTHAILAADIGGKVEGSFYMVNTSDSYWEEEYGAISTGVSAGIKDIMEAKVSAYNKVTDTFENNLSEATQYFQASGIGGANFPAITLDDFLANYKTWAESMNGIDIEECVIIGASQKNSLVPIWELLPSEYSAEKNKLKNYFDDLAKNNQSDFYAKYTKVQNETNDENFASGFGVANKPYLIKDPKQFTYMFNNSKSECYYELIGDINLGDWSQYGISNWKSESRNPLVYFTGNFDGKENTITYDIKIGKATLESWALGLFPTTNNATIKNLKVVANIKTFDPQNRNEKWDIPGGDMAQDAMVGGIVGYARETEIINCSSSGNIRYNVASSGSDTCVAGIVGYALSCDVINCSSAATIYARGRWVSISGVIACCYKTSYSNLFSTATLSADVNLEWPLGGISRHDTIAQGNKEILTQD